MDHLASRERDYEVDIESGGTTSEEDKTKDLVSEIGQTRRVFNRVLTGVLSFDGYVKPNSGIHLCSNSLKFGEAAVEHVELLIEKNSEEETGEPVAPVKKCVEGKRKKTNSTKPPKPPRPPKGPSLDAADEKLVREIAELAMRKRARIERIKALRKMKAVKTSNSNSSSLSALIITLLFCLIILFQGLYYRSHASVSMQGSPAPAVTRSESLISIQIFKNFLPDERDESGFGSPNFAHGQVSGSGPVEESSLSAR